MSMNLACCFIHAGYEYKSERERQREWGRKKGRQWEKREEEHKVKGREENMGKEKKGDRVGEIWEVR